MWGNNEDRFATIGCAFMLACGLVAAVVVWGYFHFS